MLKFYKIIGSYELFREQPWKNRIDRLLEILNMIPKFAKFHFHDWFPFTLGTKKLNNPFIKNSKIYR